MAAAEASPPGEPPESPSIAAHHMQPAAQDVGALPAPSPRGAPQPASHRAEPVPPADDIAGPEPEAGAAGGKEVAEEEEEEAVRPEGQPQSQL